MVIDNRYFIDDPEIGFYEVSKEEYEAHRKRMLQFWEQAKPKVEGIIGMPIIFGTAGTLDGDEDLRTIFFNPDNYKFK